MLSVRVGEPTEGVVRLETEVAEAPPVVEREVAPEQARTGLPTYVKLFAALVLVYVIVLIILRILGD